MTQREEALSPRVQVEPSFGGLVSIKTTKVPGETDGKAENKAVRWEGGGPLQRSGPGDDLQAGTHQIIHQVF